MVVSYPEQQVKQCPAHNDRKVTQNEPQTHQRIEIDAGGTWHIHGYEEARQVLRHSLVKQAGFLSELVLGQAKTVLKNPPILFLEGEDHHKLRRETNKFFTPAITDKQYRDFMDAFADELIVKLKRNRRADLSDLTMEMAMRVASKIVGLTDSMLPGLKSRLNGILSMAEELKNPNFMTILFGQRHMLAFLMLDVKPAIKARRKNPQNDVISYLIAQNYSDLDILTECVVYGVAGMATTREFICTALWHLLDKPHLRQRMMVGSQEERYAILHEILRLEPIIGHLYRRTTDAIEIESEGQPMTIPANTLVELNIFDSNTDQQLMGENSMAVCPMRSFNSDQKVPEYMLSFGDGVHRCPGAFVAIQESDIFLRKLLQIETLRIEKAPQVKYNEIVNGYEVRKFIITVD